MTTKKAPKWPETRFIERLRKATNAVAAGLICNEICETRLARSFVKLTRTVKSVDALFEKSPSDSCERTVKHIEHQQQLELKRNRRKRRSQERAKAPATEGTLAGAGTFDQQQPIVVGGDAETNAMLQQT